MLRMMPRSLRLPRGNDLDLLLRRGRRISAPLFQIAARRNNLSHARFMLVVPRSAGKRAVGRNRLRRRAAEFIRKRPGLVSASLDIAIICKKEAVDASAAEFYDALERILINVFESWR
jgi:ribonuclease P protein component